MSKGACGEIVPALAAAARFDDSASADGDERGLPAVLIAGFIAHRFFADGKLKTISLAGGTVTVLADAPDPGGGTWSSKGQIVFAPSNAGRAEDVSRGRDPSPATTLDASGGETAHRFPCFLPDGRQFLFVALAARNGQLDVSVASNVDSQRPAITTSQGGSIRCG